MGRLTMLDMSRPGPALFDNQIRIMTLEELANQLKISPSGLRKIIARDANFPRYKVGHQLRFNWEAVERYFRKGDTDAVS